MRIPIISPRNRPFFGVLLAALLDPGMSRASEVEDAWYQHTPASAWLAAYDPTLISRRLFTELSHEDDDAGVSTTEWKASVRGARSLREGLALGFQLEAPIKWHDDGADHSSGFGDLEARAGVVGKLSPTLRWGAAVNAKFDTAAEPALGDRSFQLRPILAVRWDASERVNLGINAEYTFTPRDEGADDVSALELKFPVAFKINERWSAALTYKPRWDFLGDDLRHRLELGGNHVFGARKQFGLSFGLEIPLSSQSFDWKLNSGLSWYF